ncbi:peroxiredoxin family protein [Dyadobacter psychrotolerans]|uniref:thioredoxin-dependent peroxiredoxin n=1 Tax=Dyadobacter psychrotolerans TaxID=2541721 RepID=A0A4R5DU29_9BACT|nr:redoxin domain-containing protein [Dyadobacter psychrotolerans]TDE18036.1 redoxin domain-containing protein [Dyadobacter psychrotolerans]
MNCFKVSPIFKTALTCASVIVIVFLTAQSLASKPVVVFPNLKIDQASTKDSTKNLKVGSIPQNPQDISPLLTGETIPAVELLNLAGKSVSLNEAVSKSLTILIFYRGGWCPYCSKQLSGIQLIEKDLHQMGYQVIAVSTDSPKNLAATMDKQKLSYNLLSDADLSVSKQFGLAFKAPANYDKILPEASDFKNMDKLLPVPSVFILDKKGKILFEYINPNITERISPELLKAAASILREI